MHGDEKSMNLLKNRAASDVRVTEDCYLKLRPLIRQHPRLLSGRANCRVCGSNHLQRRGQRISADGLVHPQYQCQGCGAWGAVKEATNTGRVTKEALE
jgi:hypothetical protein